MFPRELLSVRRRGDRIHPQLAPLDDEHLALARELIDLFEAHVGARRKAFLEDLEQHELRMGTRFKLVRGLAALLERRSTFELAAKVDPSLARRVAWEQAGRLEGGAATTPEARARVLAAAARDLGISAGEVDRALVADRDEELLLVRFDAPPDPAWLLHRYNVSLAQTLLFDATRVELEIERGFREFLGLVKLQGLMHTVELVEGGGAHRVVIDGPLSLFRDTRRYGTAIAKTVPALARCGRWTLRAEIQDKEADRRRVFEIGEDELRIPRKVADDDATYDSEVERRFAEAWASLRTPWRIEREPAALQVAGGELFIPDFGFAWGPDAPVSAYLEIVGFWTPGYLQRKREKLRKLPADTAILLAVDAHLGVGEDGFEDAPGDVLLYKGEVPLAPVTRWLRGLEGAHVDAEAARVLDAGVADEAPVVTLAGLAERHGVTAEAVERALAGLDLAGRVRLGDALVTPEALSDMENELRDGMTVGAVQALAEAHGIGDTSSLLDRLGYAVRWRGLDPASAVIERREGADTRQ